MERRKDEADLRVVKLALTKMGEKTTLRLIEIVKQFLSEVQSEIPKDELAMTKSVLGRICRSLEGTAECLLARPGQSPANQS